MRNYVWGRWHLTRTLEIEGSKGYVLDWMREKLRKMGNGQIKVIKYSLEEEGRDWEQEEKIKKQLWEDINVNEYPKGIDFEGEAVYGVRKEYKNDNTIICTKPEQTVIQRRPPSPCKIS